MTTRELDNINEAALTVRRTLYAILIYAAFCLTVLGLDFSAFNDFEGKIPIPLIDNAKMDWATFMVMGPLILIGLAAYLHLFLGYWLESPNELRKQSLPTLFNIDNPLAEIASLLIFYGVPPLILAHFAIAGVIQSTTFELQSLLLPRWFPTILFLIMLAALVLLFLRRAGSDSAVRPSSLVITPLVFFIILGLQLSATPFNPFSPQAGLAVVDERAPSPTEEIEAIEPEVVEEPAPPAELLPAEDEELEELPIPEEMEEAESPVYEAISPPEVKPAPVKQVPRLYAYAFYGIASGGSWSERYFNNIEPGMALTDRPKPGDQVQATGDVNARAGYIRYSLGRGWINEKVLSVIKTRDIFTVLEVKEVISNFYWIKVDLSEREAQAKK